MTQTVWPVDRAVFGTPEPCPKCGGRLGPAFGQQIKDGICRPMIDPTAAYCSDCMTLFPVRDGGAR